MKRVALRGALATFVAVAMLVPLAGPASAVQIGPDGFGYFAETAFPFTFEDISTTGTQVLDGIDDAFVQVPTGLPTGFPFYGDIYNDVFIASNGLLTFNAGSTDFSNSDLTDFGDGPADPLIAPLWDDWETDCLTADSVFHQTVTDPMGSRFIVQWHMVSHFNDCPTTPGNEVTFQAVLFSDGQIEFRYLDLDNGDTTESFGASASVGIRGDVLLGSSLNYVLQVSFDTASLANNQSIRFFTSLAGPGPGDGGGGGGGGGRRARTSLSLNGPDSADAGDQITLHGKMRCKRDKCKVNSKVLLFRGNQQIGSTRTDANGRFSFTTNVPGSGEGDYTAVFEGKRRCRRSSSDVLHVN
jgi:hypothetical protein